eukprot:TRINITY_DN30649_c0_g1_i1.p1 TRINITY_DN30649_c0_g1~~TRINITY_DN30649_c0_g1_i1.p1  ORF type:complete len:521 (+),score=174.87 TRINITY_DN30649_c0_g1_i1:64-1626(+)
MWSLSSGVCEQLAAGTEEHVEHPTLQVLEIAVQVGADGARRFRLLLSDGGGVVYALCTEAVAEDIRDNAIERGCVVQLTDYIVTKAVNHKNVLILVAVLVRSQQLSVIGQPVNKYVDPASAEAYPAGRPGDAGSRAPVTAVEDVGGEGRYTIRGRVVARTDLRSWTNSKGDGVLLSFELSDGTGTIKCTAFRDAAAKLDPTLVIGRSYVVTHLQTKPANAAYNTTGCAFEAIVTNATAVTELPPEAAPPGAPPPPTTVPLGDLHLQAKGNVVEAMGVLAKVGGLVEVRSDLIKRSLELADKSGRAELTVWGKQAEDFAVPVSTVVVVRGAKVGWFNNCANLSMARGAQMEAAAGAEADALLHWWASPESRQVDTTPLAEVRDVGVVSGQITAVNPTPVAYPACPQCKQRVRDAGAPAPNMPALFRCDRCNVALEVPAYNYVVSVVLTDASGSAEVVSFGDTAAALLGGIAPDVLLQQSAGNPLAHVQRLLENLAVTLEVRRKQPSGQGNHAPSFTCLRVM